jgi:hypothetical protein
MTLAESIVVLFAIHADPRHTEAITNAVKDHHADHALVASLAVAESSVGTGGTILTGAMLHRPQSACADDPRHMARVRAARRARRRPPLCIDRRPEAQAAFTARLFGRVPRRAWARMLAGYRCGPNAACQRGAGAAYAARVIAGRDRIAAALRRGR